jgi:hypothetical protein
MATYRLSVGYLTTQSVSNLGHVPFEDSLTRLFLSVEGDDADVVVLGVVCVFHQDRSVLERSLLGVGKFKPVTYMTCSFSDSLGGI